MEWHKKTIYQPWYGSNTMDSPTTSIPSSLRSGTAEECCLRGTESTFFFTRIWGSRLRRATVPV